MALPLKAIAPRHLPPRRQSGFILIATLLSLVIIAIILAYWAKTERRNWVQTRANAQGAADAQFGIGLRGFIASVQGGSVTMPSNPYTVTGVNWLKAPTCGGLAGNPATGFVPCGFNGGEYGARFNTTVTKTAATNMIVASTWFAAQPVNGGTKQSAASFASAIAEATRSQQTPPTNGMFFDVFANAAIGATTAPDPSAITPVNSGRVVLYASNAPSSDIWLRVDGTNQMLADLNMGGNSIKNAKDGSFTGSVRVQGTAEIDNGLSVTNGTADLRGGAIAPDFEVTGVGHMASQALYNMQVLTGATSYTVAKPNCTQANGGTSAPSIYVAMQGTGTPEAVQGDALYEAHANVYDNGATWTVSPTLHSTTFSLTGSSSGGNLTLNLNKTVQAESPSDQVLLVMTKCK
ncbi:type II secretion system protein [Rhodanobacter sp. 115]|uniref:type II secretion system protein n=1 Tax=Rhodanobacter sp. FW021-MT20 TaxID=1162282 RepID=UPI0034E52851